MIVESNYTKIIFNMEDVINLRELIRVWELSNPRKEPSPVSEWKMRQWVNQLRSSL